MSSKNVALIIEDQATLATLYEDALRLVGYDVVWIRDGLAAINHIEMSAPPTMIILDVNLPRMSGRDVLKHIHRNPAYNAVPVLIATANTVMARIMQQETRQQDYVLPKPLGVAEIQRIAKELKRSPEERPDYMAKTQEIMSLGDLDDETADTAAEETVPVPDVTPQGDISTDETVPIPDVRDDETAPTADDLTDTAPDDDRSEGAS